MNNSNFWLDIAVAEIVKKYPSGEIIVSSGISPSADYHVGHFREILTADALTWGIKKAGRKASHVHVVDNFDPLRRRYDFLPEEFEKYVGWPICLVPDPHGKCHKTYADHFFSEFEQYAKAMGISPEKVVRSYEDLYKTGAMTDNFEAALENVDLIRKIYKEVSNRDLEKGWTPVQVLDDENKFFNADEGDWDQKSRTIAGKSYTDGHAKLNWRLDWSGRWKVLGVMVEPFSAQEHGAAGGSYDTGKEFAKQIYGIEAPLPGARYANIHMKGDTKKMSSSKGNLVTPKEALSIMPAEILRYFVVRSKPDRILFFDPAEGLYNLIDEFSQIEDQPDHEFKEAYQFAVAIKQGSKERTISSVPFKHLVSVYQAAQRDSGVVFDILGRTGYEKQVKTEKEVITRELKFIDSWLEKYAPAEVKFSVQKQLPKAELSSAQTNFLSALAKAIAGKQLDAQAMHETIYQLKDKYELEPAQAFKAIYRVILGKDFGPKAGWFLANLDKAWLVKRLQLKS